MIQKNRRFRIPLVVFCCLIGSAIFAYPSDARSQPDGESPSAGEHAKRAQIAYDLQDWPTAIQEFQAAYRSAQNPEYLWGIAQAQRLSGDCAKAISTYKAYRRTEVTPNQATAAELQVMKCEAEILKQDAAAKSDATHKSDVAPAAFANPGSAPVQAGSPSAQARKSDVVPAASADLVSTPAQAASPSTSAQLGKQAPRKPFYKDALGDTLFVAGVAAGGIGTYFLLKGNSDMSKTSKASVYRDYDSMAGHASREQVTGVVMLSAGGLLLASATLRYLTLGGGASEERSAFILGPTSVAWFGRF